MSENPPTVTCGECGKDLDEEAHTPTEARQPCPSCGSISRLFHVSLSGTVTLHSKLQMKARHPNAGRPFIEQTVGDDLHRKSGKWMRLQRLIDRATNWYREIVTDPETRTIIHQTEEPLSEHGVRFCPDVLFYAA